MHLSAGNARPILGYLIKRICRPHNTVAVKFPGVLSLLCRHHVQGAKLVDGKVEKRLSDEPTLHDFMKVDGGHEKCYEVTDIPYLENQGNQENNRKGTCLLLF